MVLVREALHDAALDFAADSTAGANCRSTADLRAKDVGAGSDVARSFNAAERRHDCAGFDRDRAVRRVEDHHRIDLGERIDDELVRRSDHCDAAGRQPAVSSSSAERWSKSSHKLRGVGIDQIPEVLDDRAAGIDVR